MIRHKQFMTGTGRSGAAKYFTEHLSVSAYYANGVGLLQGQAFEHVGMQFREVDLAVFSALEQNLNPETGEKLTPRTNKTRKEWWFNPETGKREIREVDDRRSGMDLPMIVPKTVSEVWSENRETEMGRAIYLEFISAKDRAMALAESLAMTRVRRGDADYFEAHWQPALPECDSRGCAARWLGCARPDAARSQLRFQSHLGRGGGPAQSRGPS